MITEHPFDVSVLSFATENSFERDHYQTTEAQMDNLGVSPGGGGGMQGKKSEPPGFEDFVDPTTRNPVGQPLNKDIIKNEEFKNEEGTRNDEKVQTQDDIISFPRKPKQPKQPKRDQNDIPKVLVKGPNRLRPSLKSTNSDVRKRHPTIKLTAEAANESDIPKLLFEGLASLDAIEVEQSLEVLSQTFLHSATKCTEAVDLGAHGICILTMKKWQYNRRIQQLCCECIHNIVYNYKDGRIDIMEALAIMGALETIIRSMDKFNDSLDVQRFGLAALGNLLYGKGEGLRERARKCVEDEDIDVITTVVGATRRFSDNAMVQGCACIVLTRLLKMGDYKDRMTEASVLLDIAAAVTNHRSNAIIEKEASSFMKVYFGWS